MRSSHPSIQLTVTDAVAQTRQPAEQIRRALHSGDLRSLTPRNLDAWSRAVIAARIARLVVRARGLQGGAP